MGKLDIQQLVENILRISEDGAIFQTFHGIPGKPAAELASYLRWPHVVPKVATPACIPAAKWCFRGNPPISGDEICTLWLCQNSYWKWPFIVSFPIKLWWFSIVMLVYQMVLPMFILFSSFSWMNQRCYWGKMLKSLGTAAGTATSMLGLRPQMLGVYPTKHGRIWPASSMAFL